MASEAAQLLARGAAITLSDGSEHVLKFDFEALVLIEEREGSLLTWLNELNKGWNGKRLRVLRTGLVAGLAHERLSERQIVPLIDHRSIAALQGYLEAINAAVDEALPREDEDGEAPAAGKASGRTKRSTGSSTTTSQPSSSVVQMPSSGE